MRECDTKCETRAFISVLKVIGAVVVLVGLVLLLVSLRG